MKEYVTALKREWTWSSGWSDAGMLLAMAVSFVLVNAATEHLALPFVDLTGIAPSLAPASQWMALMLAAAGAVAVFLSMVIPVRIARKGKPAMGIFGLAAVMFWLASLTAVVYWPVFVSSLMLDAMSAPDVAEGLAPGAFASDGEFAEALDTARAVNAAGHALGQRWLMVLAVLAAGTALLLRREIKAGTFSLHRQAT